MGKKKNIQENQQTEPNGAVEETAEVPENALEDQEALKEEGEQVHTEASEQEAGKQDETRQAADSEQEASSGEETTEEDAPEETVDDRTAALVDQLKRTMAEFENFRKRTDREKSQMYDMGARDTIQRILPVLDNFQRGLAAITEEQKEDPIVGGMEMIYKQLLTTLEGMGVKAIEAVGKPFDPNYHNAVMHVEDEAAGDNEVVEELQTGYLYKDSVVRYSMVKVAN